MGLESPEMVAFVLRRILGIVCLLFGFVALVTPMTPGAWLILVGLELLGLGFLIPRPIRKYWDAGKIKLREWWRERFPERGPHRENA